MNVSQVTLKKREVKRRYFFFGIILKKILKKLNFVFVNFKVIVKIFKKKKEKKI